ncbi:hypothetical protein KIN20_019929 [Parelaphostrongylus tenuis]|uniref:Uncharacterized protein n=1 Tax=Parelaphostrongylus tenuis TaxID=148309 RepID=A0AAD5MLV6_PARTN|nr:hypothetical protein KIN20_019929 [Parelaphostrongylus tenuis]
MWAVPLPAVLLFSWCPAFAQVNVRIWQPDTDSSANRQSTKFLDLVDDHAVPTITTTTTTSITEPGITTQENSGSTTTHTSTATIDTSPIDSVVSTVHWTPPTTVDVCGETDPTALIETLKDSGIYNEIYMAPDIITASRNFPDLGGRNFMKAKSRYRCDNTCERSSELVRLVMIGDEQSDPASFESEQSWWNEWTREKRRSFSKSKKERLRELKSSLQSLLREMDEINRDEKEESDKQSEQEEFDRFFAKRLDNNMLLPSRRKRGTNSELTAKNSGLARDIIGTTIALECRNDDLQSGYRLCSSCRAVRHLPRTYFPRILNEVICGESTCVRGDGRCAQRFLPLKQLSITRARQIGQPLMLLQLQPLKRNCVIF